MLCSVRLGSTADRKRHSCTPCVQLAQQYCWGWDRSRTGGAGGKFNGDRRWNGARSADLGYKGVQSITNAQVHDSCATTRQYCCILTTWTVRIEPATSRFRKPMPCRRRHVIRYYNSSYKMHVKHYVNYSPCGAPGTPTKLAFGTSYPVKYYFEVLYHPGRSPTRRLHARAYHF